MMPTGITALLVDADTCAASVEIGGVSQLIDCRGDMQSLYFREAG